MGSPDALRKLEEGGFWLEAYRQGVKGDPLRAYQVVDRIDTLMQPYRLEATREYLEFRRAPADLPRAAHLARGRAVSRRSWRAGYETCLQMFQSGAAARSNWRLWCRPLPRAPCARSLWCCAGTCCVMQPPSRRCGAA